MAKPILDQSARVQQLLSELTFRACQIGEQIQTFQKNSTTQILGVSREFNKERKQSKKFAPLYDRAMFLKWNEDTLSRLNKNLLRLFFEIRCYEEKLQSYQSNISTIDLEVANG